MKTSHHHSYYRVLSIDPSRKGFGFAVLEGGHRLVDWGVAQLYSSNEDEFLVRIELMLDRYQPVQIVVEDIVISRRRRRACQRIKLLRRYAKRRGIPVEGVSRVMVRTAFGETGVTKDDIATTIAEKFPELKVRVPPRRKPWMSEDQQMSIFDALSFALTSLVVRMQTCAQTGADVGVQSQGISEVQA